MGIIITEEEKAYFKNKARQHEKWLKWLDETSLERSSLYEKTLEKAKTFKLRSYNGKA